MKTIEEFQKDVSTFFKLYEKKYKNNDSFYNLYYGYKVFFSPLIKNAKIWIIGINPGKGDWSEVNRYLKPRKDNEYATGSFKVASTFQKLFDENLGRFDILENETVVTNLHFLSTENENSLKKVINNEDYDTYWEKVKLWNDFLYKYINPKLILSFGKAPLVDYFNNGNSLNEYNVKNKIFTESPHWCYSYKNSPIILIKRTPSSICNREALGEMIKYILKKQI